MMHVYIDHNTWRKSPRALQSVPCPELSQCYTLVIAFNVEAWFKDEGLKLKHPLEPVIYTSFARAAQMTQKLPIIFGARLYFTKTFPLFIK